MIEDNIMIGLESHIQLATKSKLFCSCSTDSKTAKPNDNTCEICLGLPGSKPTLNEEVVKKAIALATIFGCKINQDSRFARKIYFYPDLPKGYQVTQYEEPLAINGQFSIDSNGKKKTIHIRRAHIEEDPGKIEYVGGHIGIAKQVLVDYNRSGLPLCEVVTEPDFKTIEEAVSYVKKIFHLLSYLGLIDPNQEGVMRTDANISMGGGARVELKNISGSNALERSLKAEKNRQFFLKAQGKKVEQETRVYSEETGTTILLRKKEYEQDYGYIREPDLLPLVISDVFVKNAMAEIKKLPEEVEQEIITKYKLPKQLAHKLAFKQGLYAYFENCMLKFSKAEILAKWLIGDFLKCANWHNFEIEQCPKEERFLELMEAIDKKRITEREGKEIIKRMFDNPEAIADTSKRETDIETVIGTVIKENHAAVERIRKGEDRIINFLVGAVLKKTNFKGDPKEIIKKIRKRID